MNIINNQDTILLNELKNIVSSDSEIYIACDTITAYFLYDFIKQVKTDKKIKILLEKSSLVDFSLIQSERESKRNLQLDRLHIARKAKEHSSEKVKFRSGSIGRQNLIIVKNKNKTNCFLLTPQKADSVSLGTIQSTEPIFISSLEDSSGQYLTYFKSAWDSSSEKLNYKVEEVLNKALKDYSGEEIYKYCLRHIFQYSTINERADEKLQKVGFKDSKIWELLYNFQKDAVIGAIEKIETYGGCIIADSVGLGKTFEALAVMKYYQLRNHRILVLAPKKLRENWTVYQLNDKRNILATDRLNYDVLNHTDLSRVRGKSGDIDLEMINWGNYDLVVIDESHNFRNNPIKKGMTRYKRLMEDVIKANIRTKVLMLSATPVNNRMNDLKNQVAFITEGNDEAFLEHGIESIGQVMKDAQRKFTQWFRDSDPDDIDINALMESLDGGYFRILDMLTIARSRKHIEKYYDTSDIGEFPERLKPITIKAPIDTKAQFKDIGQIYDEISILTLASYTPLKYVRPDKREEYEAKYDMTTKTGSIFKQADREQSLIHLMRVNLLKRLESSVHSFKLTTEKLIITIEKNIKKIEDHQKGEVDLDLNITEINIDDTELEDLLAGGKTKVLIQDLDLIRWKQDLQNDRDVLVNLLSRIELIDTDRDAKLKELHDRISDKITNPINPSNKKVIIFTAFADTAKYLYENLAKVLKSEHNVNSALVTGGGSNKTNMPNCRTDLNSILTNFSPHSKKRDSIFPNEKQEIDILFCTDCISEGQNLQDCDFLINYDIHWNPVRIIQRFGRIDRIGSKNTQIQLLNFFPSMELDKFIDLVARVQGRMVMLDVSATGEDNIISKNSKEMQDLDYRKRQLKQLQDQVIDLEDVQGNISITDLTFNDFKMDLEKSTNAQLEAIDDIPPASHAIVQSPTSIIPKGVIFCLKDMSNDFENQLKNNILYPYFLVYISTDGSQMIKASQSKLALDYFRKLCMGNNSILHELISELNKETKHMKNMSRYTNLLDQAIEDIVGVQEAIGLDSLATPGGTTLKGSTALQKENLELIAYLLIR